MYTTNKFTDRRNFIIKTAAVATGLTSLALFPQTGFGQQTSTDDDINIVGPKQGYSPQIGTLVSMMTWMRMVVLSSVEKLNQQELDFLFDAHSNTIGALLLHLAAAESFYQTNTFGETSLKDFSETDKKRWDIPMNLGDAARKSIKGHDLKY